MMPRILAPLAGLFAAFAAAGCAYRFTNEHIKRPEGIRSVAVEAVYDTSREVLAHEMLWEALQNAFAADGHLRLEPQSSADALVRAHLKQAFIAATGSPVRNGADKDPASPLGADDAPFDPTRFRKLNQAGQYRQQATLTATVDVEVWSLRTRSLLMHRSYPLSGTFYAVRQTSLNNDWLRYEEGADATFKSLSKGLAQQVVKDLIVQ